ncbi:4-hydroxythreonine-4-phosphate dehydrogenase PdxA [Pseudodesulfovibrio senegalensis]|jgi:4-hydroxythreonine-4-phosphate dehydrogenase|uniref:4-hydroxythreonine-4-phosphate dehydrogenase PdxA n=1 Tax=Pseudodesulfovibrio senegalensis TaxID=1721087 RepID=A0A6N6N3Z5_9BACT|nr:4-hydroxythreonine-4-phosphate dehydrogenase PdxA [Pseudodesulfovibrio senegalensis]KAB1442297.1 4-hydroxythreonine-4-phosphate dehydrogenase PdxA [Pseudodesulfovibrio senegalensis]
MSMKTICVTLGDPGGLGPELVQRCLSGRTDARYLMVGPESCLKRLLEQGQTPFWTRIAEPGELPNSGGVFLLEPPQLARIGFPEGAPSMEGGLAAGVALEKAVDLLQSGVAHGLLTCPLNKAMLQKAGFDFPGHTEFLATRLGVGPEGVCMHLCGHDPDNADRPLLRVSLVTTHPRLADVPGLVTRERILRCLRLTRKFLDGICLSGPIAVCGVNPHAGESGRIGDEEIKTVGPALEAANDEGLNVEGPIPADTVFHFAASGKYPAVLAMYHDQGLGPLKLLHFGEAVNVTLGLPYPRTSPDHGTGYDVVGTGKASTKSFEAALDMVLRMTGACGGPA